MFRMPRKLSFTSSRRGFVGIGTLLIFIAVILVAAVAAGVLTRTASSLQSRALSTGTAAREQISAGVEIISIRGYANITAKTVYGYEIGLRVLPSSGSLNPESMTLLYRDNYKRFSAFLQGPHLASYVSQRYTGLARDDPFEDNHGGTFSLPLLFNIESVDALPEAFGFTQTFVQGADTDALLVLKSSQFFSGGEWNTSPIVQGDSFGLYSGLSHTGNVSVPLYDPDADLVHGVASGINLSGGLVEVTFSSESSSCSWEYLKRNTRFCLEERIGNGNKFLDEGELWVLRYRLQQPDAVTPEQTDVEFRIIAKDGLVTTHRLALGNIFNNELLVLYP